jgi:hypothetical protein
MIRGFYTLNIGFVLLLLSDNGRFYSGPPNHAQFSQGYAKTASEYLNYKIGAGSKSYFRSEDSGTVVWIPPGAEILLY